MGVTVQRLPIEQTFFGQALLVSNITPTPLDQQITQVSMIQTFIICNPSTNTNSVFFGDNNVSLTTGLEIQPGTGPIQFVIQQGRQLYELQDPEMITAQATTAIQSGQCQLMDPTSIPVVSWNPSNIWFLAVAAPTTVNVVFMRSVYV